MIEKALKMMMAKKKQGSAMSDQEKDAKMSVLHDLRGQAMDKMGEGLKKAKSGGLHKGAEKAEETVDSTEQSASEHEVESDIGVGHESGEHYGHSPDETESHERSESAEFEAGEHECSEEEMAMSEDELDKKIEALSQLKQSKAQPKL